MRHGESEFNVLYKKTRVDPGIRDPKLTVLGQRQVKSVVPILEAHRLNGILTSPYTRALQTANLIAKALKLSIEVDPLIGERAAFVCDIGTPCSELRRNWPQLNLRQIPEIWWPTLVESEDYLDGRCLKFRNRCSVDPNTLIVSHWGFIRGLTGLEIGNAGLVQFDPLEPHPLGGMVVPTDIPC